MTNNKNIFQSYSSFLNSSEFQSQDGYVTKLSSGDCLGQFYHGKEATGRDVHCSREELLATPVHVHYFSNQPAYIQPINR